VKSRIADILDSVYEKDHVRADISQFTDDAGAMMGNNLKTHLEALDRQMRDAAANLDFEKAARIRDEIKRLREMELAISDDPLAKYADMESPVSGREKGKHNKGRQRHRTVDDGQSPSGRPAAADRSAPPRSEPRSGDSVSERKPSSLFSKPSLDNMGPGTDMPTPANAVSRSLFKKQSAREAHGSDFGIPGGEKSLFRKNTLDEMTVRRTEKPVEGTRPAKPQGRPAVAPDGASPRDAEGAQKERGRSEPRSGDSMSERDSDAPIRRERAGIGSYEDPAETQRRNRRPSKTGRPGQ
jgi:excinuclease ABC subunit B